MAAPRGGNLVKPRQQRVRVARHVQKRKVTDIERIRQSAEGNCQKKRIGIGCGTRKRHPRADAARGTYKRQHALHDREHQRKYQRKVADFSNHGAISLKVEKSSLICCRRLKSADSKLETPKSLGSDGPTFYFFAARAAASLLPFSSKVFMAACALSTASCASGGM